MQMKDTRQATRRHTTCWPRALWLGCALMANGVAHADWSIPAGAVVDMPGAMALGCTDLYVAGTLTIGPGASITEARNVHIQPGGSLQVASGGSLQLAQQWLNEGSVSAASGAQVTRVGSAACPAVGALGPINVQSTTGTFTATPVPTLNGAALSGLAVLLGGLAWRTRRRSQRTGHPSLSNPSHSSRPSGSPESP